MKISVSILSCKDKISGIKKINKTSADFLHIDFMDGKFTENKSLNIKEVKEINKISTKKLDIHLMVKRVKKYIKKFKSLNVNYMVFHIEAGKKKTKKLLKLIRSYNIKNGLAISPETDINELEEYITSIDMILLMSVTPGKGGQNFITESEERLLKIKELCQKYNVNPVISVDGGINNKTKDLVKDADMLVAGSYITNSDNYEESIKILKSIK